MILEARNISHLVALVLNQGVPGGGANIKPVVYDHGGKLYFRLVRADLVSEVLGKMPGPLADWDEISAQVMEAYRKWGYPTAAVLADAFPRLAVP